MNSFMNHNGDEAEVAVSAFDSFNLAESCFTGSVRNRMSLQAMHRQVNEFSSAVVRLLQRLRAHGRSESRWMATVGAPLGVTLSSLVNRHSIRRPSLNSPEIHTSFSLSSSFHLVGS